MVCAAAKPSQLCLFNMFSITILEIMIFQKDFDNNYKEFKIRTVDFEHRFANLLCLAFKDCSELESVFKVS